LLFRDRHQVFQFAQGQARLAGRRQAFAVEQSQNLLAFVLFLIDRLGGIRRRLKSLLGHANGPAASLRVVGGAFFGIA
jgi:hypothetical protein